MAFNSIPKVPAHRMRRFLKQVHQGKPGECWPFHRANQYGYAQLRVGWVNTMAHRFAWVIENGPIPKGMCVCHRCDNPPCCNPAHLFLGTKGDNNRDRSRKGRTAKYEGHWKAILDAKMVAEVFSLRIKGWTQQAIAYRFGIQQPAVWKILAGRNWRGVKGRLPAP